MGSMSAEAPGEQSNDYDHHTSIHHGRVLKVYCQDGRWSGRGGLGQRWRKRVSGEKQADLPRLGSALLGLGQARLSPGRAEWVWLGGQARW